MTTFKIANSNGVVLEGKWDKSAAAHIKGDGLGDLVEGLARFVADLSNLYAGATECIIMVRPLKRGRKCKSAAFMDVGYTNPSRN